VNVSVLHHFITATDTLRLLPLGPWHAGTPPRLNGSFAKAARKPPKSTERLPLQKPQKEVIKQTQARSARTQYRCSGSGLFIQLSSELGPSGQPVLCGDTGSRIRSAVGAS